MKHIRDAIRIIGMINATGDLPEFVDFRFENRNPSHRINIYLKPYQYDTSLETEVVAHVVDEHGFIIDSAEWDVEIFLELFSMTGVVA